MRARVRRPFRSRQYPRLLSAPDSSGILLSRKSDALVGCDECRRSRLGPLCSGVRGRRRGWHWWPRGSGMCPYDLLATLKSRHRAAGPATSTYPSHTSSSRTSPRCSAFATFHRGTRYTESRLLRTRPR